MSDSVHTVERRTETLHPKMSAIVLRLAKALRTDYETGVTKTFFDIFETYRSPERQLYLLSKGTTKAGAWQSAHNFGLAVDFVPHTNGIWTWDVERVEWDYMINKAKTFGLLAGTISWDLPHIEHPKWPTVRALLK